MSPTDRSIPRTELAGHQKPDSGGPERPAGRAGKVLHLESRFASYAEFNAGVREWGTDFRQIGRGRLVADLAQQLTDEASLLQLRFNRPVAMIGAPPPRARTFGMVGLDAGVTWNGSDVHPHQVLHFEADKEFVSLAPAGFVARTISVGEDLLESIAADLGYTDFTSDLRRSQTILPARAGEIERLVARMDAPSKSPRAFRQILEDLILILAGHHAETAEIGRASYTRIVDEAIDFIIETARHAPTVGEVCANLGVSLRTLNRAFHSRLGHGPKASILAIRLHGARRELIDAEAGTRVRDVAGRWGFWHMSDFAERYRREFGELPSRSLAARPVGPPERLVTPAAHRDRALPATLSAT